VIARIEALGGASGNMLLGSLIDAGLDVERLSRDLGTLPLPAWRLEIERVTRRGIAAIHVDVRYPEEHAHRHLPDILAIVAGGALPEKVRQQARAVFERLAAAEATVHGIGRDEVHFHEVGAVDAIVDIVGVVYGVHLLGIDTLYVSPLPVGTGPIQCEHGVMPNPAPATAELLRGAPLRFTEIPGELVTPTAAALLATLGRFAAPPPGAIRAIGWGAGSRDPIEVANVVRTLVLDPGDGPEHDQVIELEANIDDMSPQIYEHVIDRLLEAGALDVTLTPLVMKKSRPAVRLGVICRPGDEESLAALVLAETTTLGVRMQTLRRRLLPRETREVETSLGRIRVKIAAGRPRPEHDDCRRLAREHGLPLVEVMRRIEAEVGMSQM
jgi:uncharacterized protein (TIGR00299 family) protein